MASQSICFASKVTQSSGRIGGIRLSPELSTSLANYFFLDSVWPAVVASAHKSFVFFNKRRTMSHCTPFNKGILFLGGKPKASGQSSKSRQRFSWRNSSTAAAYCTLQVTHNPLHAKQLVQQHLRFCAQGIKMRNEFCHISGDCRTKAARNCWPL